MGSSFYTFTEAANRLNRSKRSLHNYIKRGFLRREVINGEAFLNREDVDRFAEDSGVDAPSMNRRSFIEMQNRTKKLEDQMRTVMHILQLRDDRLRPTLEQADGFYKAVWDSLSRTGKWSLDEVVLWVKQFERMDEVFLETVCRVKSNPNAWVPFLRLCTLMLEFADAVNDPEHLLEWKTAAKGMSDARSTLRTAVSITIEMNRGTSLDAYFDAPEDPKAALVRNMTAAKLPNGKKS